MPQSLSLFPSRPRQSALVYATTAALAQESGPKTDTRFAVVLSLGPVVFSWALGDDTTADDVNVIAPSGGSPGRWRRARFDERGEDLTDAAQTVTVAGKRHRVIPAATLTANRVITLDDEGAAAGDEILITRNGTENFTATIANGGAGAGNVAVMPAGARAWCLASFDGTNWIHKASGLALGAS